MPSRPDPALLDLLYRALRSERGIVVATDEPERLRQKLYAIRKTDADLACLSLDISRTAPKTELWIVKKSEPSNAE